MFKGILLGKISWAISKADVKALIFVSHWQKQSWSNLSRFFLGFNFFLLKIRDGVEMDSQQGPTV